MKNKKKAPVFAEEWQLSVLKKLYSEITRPTSDQRLAAAAETGLDEAWIRNWFTRQNAKVALRKRKRKGRATSADSTPFVVPPFRLNVKPRTPSDPPQDSPPDSRPDSADATPGPHPVESIHIQPTTPMTDLQASSCEWSMAPAANVSERSASSTPIPSLFSVDVDSRSEHYAGWPSYSRDPLHNRHPDFSQFFLPGVHEKFHNSEVPVTFNDLDSLFTNDGISTHHTRDPQNMFNHCTFSGSPPGLQDFFRFPVSFTVRLCDLGLQAGQSFPLSSIDR